MKSFKPKAERAASRRRTMRVAGATPSRLPRRAPADYTHASTTYPDARPFRQGRGAPGATTEVAPEPATGKEAKPCQMGHLLMENCSGLIVDATHLGFGTAEREAAEATLGRQPGPHRVTLAADKAYDVADFVADRRALNVTPHVTQNTATDARRSTLGPAPPRLCRQPAGAQADRGSVRLDQDGGRPQEDPASRHRPGRLAVHVTATACTLVRLPELLATG